MSPQHRASPCVPHTRAFPAPRLTLRSALRHLPHARVSPAPRLTLRQAQLLQHVLCGTQPVTQAVHRTPVGLLGAGVLWAALGRREPNRDNHTSW